MEFSQRMYQSVIARLIQALPAPSVLPDKDDSPLREEWHLYFRFSSDPEKRLRNPPQDVLKQWTACLDLTISDVPSLMQDGLYLAQENVQERENHVHEIYANEHKRYYLRRCFTVVDTKWSGRLGVTSWTYEPVRDFRIHHLSADKVYNAQVLDKDGNVVYCYDMCKSYKNANYMYDDMPMDGLWPWPKKEREEEREEAIGDEGKGDEGEKEVEGEEEELVGSPPQESEYSLIDLEVGLMDDNNAP
ncbi:hypothetical protein N0V84_006807 [Fusarium piperis]|uniref:Uncharacterized protein n=1 Tax=Fusarium piperis TaxID=1435070 RepID=A0A9W8WB36_9HYPO|nr:hypothetical protein N0V84_006807 [Fusarium piperis]